MTNAQATRLATYVVRDLRRCADDLEVELAMPETARALRVMATAVEASVLRKRLS